MDYLDYATLKPVRVQPIYKARNDLRQQVAELVSKEEEIKVESISETTGLEIPKNFHKAKTVNGQWVFGTLLEYAPRKTYIKIMGGNELIAIDERSVCRYIGIKDCNGNLIFEHDMVECTEGTPLDFDYSEWVGEVEYMAPFWCIGGNENLWRTRIEITGNKFD